MCAVMSRTPKEAYSREAPAHALKYEIHVHVGATTSNHKLVQLLRRLSTSTRSNVDNIYNIYYQHLLAAMSSITYVVNIYLQQC